MIYQVEMKTESFKTSYLFQTNDLDKAEIFFKQCVSAHWDILGDIEIVMFNIEHKNVLRKLTKDY